MLCKQAKCGMKVATRAWRQGGPICQGPFIKYEDAVGGVMSSFYTEGRKGSKTIAVDLRGNLFQLIGKKIILNVNCLVRILLAKLIG